MRILMLDNEFPPLGGGMGTANQALLREFAHRDDLEIDLVTSALGGLPEFEKFAERIDLYKVPVWNGNIHHSSNRELAFYAAQALALSIKLHRKKPYDLCFAWSAVPAGAVALALHTLFKLPYMVWVSGPDIPGFEERYRYLYPILAPLLKRVWRHAQPTIAKCQEEADLIRKVDASIQVEIIPNGVDLSTFQISKDKNDDGYLNIVCVARLIERKGQRHLIQAVKKLVDENIKVKAILVGEGDARAKYRRMASEMGVEDHIDFAGYVPREEIARYYASADVFVLPSFNEGMSLAALEALGAGLPLVLTRTGGTDRLIEDNVNGLTFSWGDVETLAANLYRLASDRNLLSQMSEASRRKAEIYAWPTIASRYVELFVRLSQAVD